MKVAVSSTGTSLTSTIDERFGRCRCFLIVETDDMSFEVVDNTNADLSPAPASSRPSCWPTRALRQ